MTAGLSAACLVLVTGVMVRQRWRVRRARQRLRAGAMARRSWPLPTIHRRRRRTDPLTQLPALLDAVARQCSSGDSLTAAFQQALAAHACAPLFAPTIRALHGGATLVEALHEPPTSRHDDVLLAWHVLTLCATHGGVVSEPLDRAAATLRDRHAITQERRAQSAQARLSARVLTVAPLVFAGWTATTTPTVRNFLGTPAGAICLALGAATNVAGWAWMNRIVGRAV